MCRRPLATLSLLLTLAASNGCSDDDAREYEGYCTVTLDRLTDGTLDSITTRTYTAAGDIATIETDADADGQVDARTTYTYDGTGLLITESEDSDANGQPNRIISYSYDANGELVSVRSDLDADGQPDSITDLTYHANGEVASERRDSNGDGWVDIEFLYDEDGNQVQWGWDLDGDNVADHGHTLVYDAEGKLLTDTLYQDAPFGDPVPNYIDEYTYDGSGHLIEILRTGYIPVESIRMRTTVTWMPGYLEMTESCDMGDDGTVDSTVHRIWDAAGNVLLEEEDYDADGVPELHVRQVWDGELLVTKEWDDDFDGVLDHRIDYSYDGRGLEVRAEIDTDSPPDGEPELVVTTTYDEAGNVKKAASEDMTAGTVDTTSYDYSCW